MRETWYVLEDGTAVDPGEVGHVGGVLRHKGGAAVAMRGDVHRSRSVDPEAERAKAKAEAASKAKAREMRPEPAAVEPAAPGYKTRESKTR